MSESSFDPDAYASEMRARADSLPDLNREGLLPRRRHSGRTGRGQGPSGWGRWRDRGRFKPRDDERGGSGHAREQESVC